MHSEQNIIEGCLRQEKFFQELLYSNYASKMFGICLRYAPDREVAHDLLQEGFIKVFQTLHQFKGNSALGSWMYRIFINTSINYVKRKLNYPFEVIHNEKIDLTDDTPIDDDEKDLWLDHITPKEALEMVQNLPEKYRLIINLYAIEKMKHHEIAEVLNISEGTSRSQLARARKILSDELKAKLKTKIGK